MFYPFKILVLVIAGFQFQIVTSQVKLFKNRNLKASHLQHYINETKDSLVLNSTKKIKHITFIYPESKCNSKKRAVNSNSIKLNLYKNLRKGRNIVMVKETSGNIIVFSVLVYKALKPPKKPKTNKKKVKRKKTNNCW